MTDEQDDKPKIIVDEDWKEQVQTEKEVQKKLEEEGQQDKPAATGGEPLPPASFSTLVMTLATQAMAALGQLSEPQDGKITVELEYGKHLIDTLAMLEEKTKGNLTNDEAAMLENALHQLRMLYVAVERQVTAASRETADNES